MVRTEVALLLTLAVNTVVAGNCTLTKNYPCQHCFNVACHGYNITDLKDFFAQELPTKEFVFFSLNGTDIETTNVVLTDNLFNGASFSEVWLHGYMPKSLAGSFASSVVHVRYALQPVPQPEGHWWVAASGGTLDIQTANWTTLPAIDCVSPNIFPPVYVGVSRTPLASISTGLLKSCSSVEALLSVGPEFTKLQKGLFHLDGTSIIEIHPMVPLTAAYLGSSNMRPNLTVAVQETSVSKIEPGFINTDTLPETEVAVINLQLQGNKLEVIAEEVFRPYFDMKNLDMQVSFAGNPVACNCSVAWLVRNSSYLDRLGLMGCGDKGEIHRLHPQDFAHCP